MSQPPDLNAEQLPGVAKGAAFTLVFEFLDKLLGFVFAILVPKLIGLANFGVYNIGVSLNHIFSTLSLAGLPQGVVRDGSVLYEHGQWGRLRGTFRFALTLSTSAAIGFGALLIVFARPLAGLLLHEPDLAWTLWLVGIAIPATAVCGLLVQMSLALRVVRHTAVVKYFCEPFLKLVSFAGLFALGLGLGAALGGFTLAMVACAAIAGFLFYRLLRRVPPAPTEAIDRRRLLLFSLPLVGPMIMANVLTWVDIILLGVYADNLVVGLFSLALKVVLIPEVIPRAFAAPTTPRIAALLADNRLGDSWNLYREVGRWTLGLALPCYLFLILRADLCLAILGPQFVPGSLYIAVLSLGPLVVAGLGPAEAMLSMGGHSRLMLINTLAVSSLNLAAALALVPQLGAPAMAWIITGTWLAYRLAMAVEVYFLFGFFPVSPRVLSVTLAAVPAALFLYWMRRAPLAASIPLELALEMVLFSLIYIASLFVLAVNREDRLVLVRMIQRIRDHLSELRRGRSSRKFL